MIYKDPGSEPQNEPYIEITFRGRDAIISGTDEAFCGSGVTLKGTYKKNRRPGAVQILISNGPIKSPVPSIASGTQVIHGRQ